MTKLICQIQFKFELIAPEYQGLSPLPLILTSNAGGVTRILFFNIHASWWDDCYEVIELP